MKQILLTTIAAIISLSALAQTNATLVKSGSNYILGDKFLTDKQVGNLYQQKCPEAYQIYKSAKACTAAGCTLVGLGGLELVGIAAYNRALDPKSLTVGASIGTIVTCTGLIVVLCAPLKYSKAVDVYNEKTGTQFTLEPYIGSSEVGLAIKW